MIISGRYDLIRWIKSRNPHITDTIVSIILDEILFYQHPRFGYDWSKFLSQLPQNLVDLLPANK